MDEFHLCTNESSALYKEKMKLYHDHRIEKRELTVGDLILLFDLMLKLFPSKLKSRLRGPNRVVTMYSYGAIRLENNEALKFKVNDQRVKHYLSNVDEVKMIFYLVLSKIWVTKNTQVMPRYKSYAS